MNSWLYPITQQGMVASGSSGYPYDNANSVAWSNYYQTLANYRLLQSRIAASADSSTMNNMYGMLKTLMAYKTFKATNYYGDMPYTKAGYAPVNGTSGYTATYDKQADIYTAILPALNSAVHLFTTHTPHYPPRT